MRVHRCARATGLAHIVIHLPMDYVDKFIHIGDVYITTHQYVFNIYTVNVGYRFLTALASHIEQIYMKLFLLK